MPPVLSAQLCRLPSAKPEPGGRQLGSRELIWVPLDSFVIERKEKLHYPDGRHNNLSATITRDPRYYIQDTKSTRTDYS